MNTEVWYLPYLNDWNILESKCTYGSYYAIIEYTNVVLETSMNFCESYKRYLIDDYLLIYDNEIQFKTIFIHHPYSLGHGVQAYPKD